MNRYKLNQILEIILFPVIDSEEGKYDHLLACYRAYRNFIEESKKLHSNMRERMQKNAAYKKVQREQIAYLTERNHWRVKSEDDIQMLWELFYPMQELEQHMQRIAQVSGNFRDDWVNISYYYLLKMLPELTKALITYRDGAAAIRLEPGEGDNKIGTLILDGNHLLDRVEVWNLLCRLSVPDLYIVIAAVENNLGMEALYEQGVHLALSDKLLIKSMKKGLSENHLHFGAALDYDIVWLGYMDIKFMEDLAAGPCSTESYTRIEMAMFRFFAARYLEEAERTEKNFVQWLRQVNRSLMELVEDLYEGNYQGTLSLLCQREILDLYYQSQTGFLIRECDYLLDQVYRKYVEYKISSEFILLYQSYCYIKSNPRDVFFSRLFLQYIRLKNEKFYHSHENFTLQGLKYFTKKYAIAKSASKVGLSEKEWMMEIFRSQARIRWLKKLEIRIAPEVKGEELEHLKYSKSRGHILQQLYSQIYQVFDAYRGFILESIIGVRDTWNLLNREARGTDIGSEIKRILEAAQEKPVQIPVMGMVFHFIKEEHLEDLSGYYCWRSILEYGKDRSYYRLLKRYFMQNIAVALEEIRRTIPRIDEYIVGIDAASDENAMEPWMFASVYKTMRSHHTTIPVVKGNGFTEEFNRIQNIGFTYHVGEDFRHMISGLRHVDEVIEEFGYKAGDRLGHALVLGTDVKQWIRNNEVVAMPVQEHMENLLWIWGKCIQDEMDLPVRLSVLEHQIMKIAEKIYYYPEEITVSMLHQAYKEKFQMTHMEIARRMLQKETEGRDSFCRRSEEDRENFCGKCQKRKDNRWTKDKLLLTNYCPVFEEKYEAIELVPVREQHAVIYQKIQDCLIKKVEQKGLYIEANPTSNLTIGEFSYMEDHPIFYLNQGKKDEKHHVMVTINSDDPLVFHTNVENEMAYIYYAAQAQGVARNQVLQWIDEIRQYGMDASFVQKQKEPGQILLEVEMIMKEIRRKIHRGV